MRFSSRNDQFENTKQRKKEKGGEKKTGFIQATGIIKITDIKSFQGGRIGSWGGVYHYLARSEIASMGKVPTHCKNGPDIHPRCLRDLGSLS